MRGESESEGRVYRRKCSCGMDGKRVTDTGTCASRYPPSHTCPSTHIRRHTHTPELLSPNVKRGLSGAAAGAAAA